MIIPIIGDYTTQSIGDYDTPIDQPGFNGYEGFLKWWYPKIDGWVQGQSQQDG